MVGETTDGGSVLTDGASMRVDVLSHLEEVASVRRAVASFLLDRGVSSFLVDDIRLITSELVTNAILHGKFGLISVELEVEDEIHLRVTGIGPATALPPVDHWRPAAPAALAGRGLGIVRQLADDVGVEGDADHTTVSVRRRVPDGGGDQ